MAVGHAAFSRRVWDMSDLLLMYRAVGAETREDYLRGLAEENGLPFPCVRRLADRLGERQDFGSWFGFAKNGGG
jgi:hypothetical protein